MDDGWTDYSILNLKQQRRGSDVRYSTVLALAVSVFVREVQLAYCTSTVC